VNVERARIIGYLAGAGWTRDRRGQGPDPALPDRFEGWARADGQFIVAVPTADAWPTMTPQEYSRMLNQVSEADRTPRHIITGVTPFDPRTDPILHANGRGRRHDNAFRAEAEDRQIRHLRREHSTDPDSVRRLATSPSLDGALCDGCQFPGSCGERTGPCESLLASLAEAHSWHHERFDR
jgi:hypothetical protein